MSTREQDLELWKQWKRTKSRQDASRLVNNFMPLVRRDISRYYSNQAPSVVDATAKKLILEAAESYNPTMGVALSTHVRNYMKKMNQESDAWRSPIKIPENRKYKHGTFMQANQDLQESLGREPTISELSDKLSWSQAEVKRMLLEIRGEYSEDRPFVSTYNPSQSLEEEMLDYIYYDLTSKEKLLLEYTTGYGGKPKLSNPEIMKRMNWNQNQLSYERRKLADKIEGMLRGHR